MLPGTVTERRQLALDIIDHLNFFQRIFENKHSYVLALLLHTITDPRIQNPIILAKNTRVIAALKKCPELWIRVKPFAQMHPIYGKQCKCGHGKTTHKLGGPCMGTKYYNDHHNCRCKGFRENEL